MPDGRRPAATEERVLEIVRGAGRASWAASRAERAVAPGASLERDLGLGSLERVELLVRLEARLRPGARATASSASTRPAEIARAARRRPAPDAHARAPARPRLAAADAGRRAAAHAPRDALAPRAAPSPSGRTCSCARTTAREQTITLRRGCCAERARRWPAACASAGVRARRHRGPDAAHRLRLPAHASRAS